jgi:hypothetical protein
MLLYLFYSTYTMNIKLCTQIVIYLMFIDKYMYSLSFVLYYLKILFMFYEM